MINAKDLKPEMRVHSLLVGDSGSGKTVAACSWPGKTIIADLDGRAFGIYGCPFLKPRIDSGEIEIEQFSTGKDLLEKVDKFLALSKAKANSGELKNFIFDGVSSATRSILAQSLHSDDISHYVLRNIKLANGNLKTTQVQDFNVVTTALNYLIYEELKSFKCNVFLTAHLKDRYVSSPSTEDPDRVIVTGRCIKVPGQLSDDIPQWYNETWEFYVDDTIKSESPRRYVMFRSKIAKTCFKELPVKLEITDKPLYETIMEKINGMSMGVTK